MAFTEAQLLADLQASTGNQAIRIIAFIPGATYTDVYVEGRINEKQKTGPMVQILNSLTAAQAHVVLDASMT